MQLKGLQNLKMSRQCSTVMCLKKKKKKQKVIADYIKKKPITTSVRKRWCAGDIRSRFLFLQAAVCSTGSSLLSYQPHNRSIAVWKHFRSLCLTMCAWQSVWGRGCSCVCVRVCVCVCVSKVRATDRGCQFERHGVNRHTTQSCVPGWLAERDGCKERWTDEWQEGRRGKGWCGRR